VAEAATIIIAEVTRGQLLSLSKTVMTLNK